MHKRDEIRLAHMLDAAEQALAFAHGRSRAELDKDLMLVFALVKAIEIVGEAASQVTKTTRDRHSQIPWTEIIGMRHRLIHAYFDINLDILWQTIQQDLPSLRAELHQALQNADKR
jgi:uncharacterized protein with HEPN domain